VITVKFEHHPGARSKENVTRTTEWQAHSPAPSFSELGLRYAQHDLFTPPARRIVITAEPTEGGIQAVVTDLTEPPTMPTADETTFNADPQFTIGEEAPAAEVAPEADDGLDIFRRALEPDPPEGNGGDTQADEDAQRAE
jgi:hypothetical protein